MTIVDPIRPTRPAVWSRRALRCLDEAAATLEGVAFRALMAPDGADLALVSLSTGALDTLHSLGAQTDSAPVWSDATLMESIAQAGQILLGIDPSALDSPHDRDRLGRVIADLSAFHAG